MPKMAPLPPVTGKPHQQLSTVPLCGTTVKPYNNAQVEMFMIYHSQPHKDENTMQINI